MVSRREDVFLPLLSTRATPLGASGTLHLRRTDVKALDWAPKATQLYKSAVPISRNPDTLMSRLPHPRPHHCSVTLDGFLNDNLLAHKPIILLGVAGIIRRNKFLEASKWCFYLVRICGTKNNRFYDLQKWKSLSCVRLFATPRNIQSMEFSRPESWHG